MQRSPQRILLVRLGAVGDVLRTLPLLHALRAAHPRAALAWAVEEPSAPLLRELPALDAVHVLPRRSIARHLRRPWDWPEAARQLAAFRRELAGFGADLALDVHGTLKAALVARMARSPRTVGFAPGGSKEGAARLYDRAHPFPAEPMSRVRRALLLGVMEGLLDGDPDALERDADFGLRFPEARAAGARAFAQGRLPLVVLFPFASAAGQGKRWPLSRHAQLALELSPQCRVVLAWGSPREREELAALGGDLELAPPTDLVELAELLRCAALLVTGDTGPMHLAAAVGTPVLALFGPSDPIVNRPWGPGHEVLVRSPLDLLSVDEVAAAARALLARGRPG